MNYKEFKILNKTFKEMEDCVKSMEDREVWIQPGRDILFKIKAKGICEISVSASPQYIVKNITIDELKKLHEELSKFFN